MSRPFARLLVHALLGTTPMLLGADDSPTGGESAVAPLAPGAVLDPSALDPAWQALFEQLRDQGAVYAAFTERRWFAVRKEPVVLHGELRHSPEHGLSLRYTEPTEQLMIIDTRGILLRNAAGRTRALKADPRAPQMDAMLLHVLRFDLAALDKVFAIRGAREGPYWRLDLSPRSSDLARTLGSLTVEGEGAAVGRLEFSRGPKQRVEVRIGEARTGVTFSADELARYFR